MGDWKSKADLGFCKQVNLSFFEVIDIVLRTL